MIQLFFKTRDQMGPSAKALTKGQENELCGLIDALCVDTEDCAAAKMAQGFTEKIEIAGARLMVENHRIPNLFTELYLSFPTGSGHSGLLKLFRWKENHLTKIGVGTSDETEFSIRQLKPGALRDAAIHLFNGMVPRRARHHHAG